jgi:hypothetical protein
MVPGRRPSFMPHGPMAPQAVKLIAGHGAGGGRGPRPGRRDAVGVLDLHPGQVLDPAQAPGRGGPGSSSGPDPSGGQAPGMSRQGRSATVQLASTVAARNARTCPGITLSDTGGQGEGTHSRGSMRRPALPGRRQGKACSSAAGRLRSGAAGASPSAISLAEHRVEFGVGPDRPDLLRAAAGGGDLCSPLQRVLA